MDMLITLILSLNIVYMCQNTTMWAMNVYTYYRLIKNKKYRYEKWK